MNVSLVMFKSDGSRRDFPVTKPRIVVGRTNACDLRIPLSSVSRQHCEFRLEGDQFKLRDLGSSNGTFRNNDRINQETLLQAGDEIVIGPVVFTVVIDGQPDRINPVRTVVDRNATDNGEQTTVEPQRVSFETGVAMAGVDGEVPAQVDDDQDTARVSPVSGADEDDEDDFLPILGDDDDEDDDLPTLDEEDEDLPILLDDDEDEDDDLR